MCVVPSIFKIIVSVDYTIIWVFPKTMVPPNHPFVHRVFHEISTIHFGGFTTPIFGNIHIYIYLEPVCPLFFGRQPSKTRPFLIKQGSFGFQVYIYIYSISSQETIQVKYPKPGFAGDFLSFMGCHGVNTTICARV